VLSQVCEAFGCVPSVAERELDQHGALVFDMLDLRHAAQAYRAYHTTGMEKKARRALLESPAVGEVMQHDFDRTKE